MLIHGHGINDMPKISRKKLSQTKEYLLWQGLISRCYSEKFHKKRPAYKGCSASENFKSFSYFYEWCQNQIGFGNDGWQLDKDLLIKGNRTYSEDACVFLPMEINCLFGGRIKSKNIYPIGVLFHKGMGKFASKIKHNNKNIYLGYFDNPVDAFNAYKEKKKEIIINVANKWKDQIDPRAYEAMINYDIDIND